MERKGTLSGLSGMNARNLRAIRERYTYIVRGTGVNMTILCFSVGFRQIGTAIDNASANYHEQNKMPEFSILFETVLTVCQDHRSQSNKNPFPG